MEDVREYFHLYLGQRFVMKITNPMSFYKYTAPMTFEVNALKAAYDKGDNHIDPILALRRLDSMTEEEFEEFKKLSDGDFSKMTLIESMCKDNSYTRLCHTAFAQKYLLSKGFWLFNDSAFDKGLIIDSKTLNKEV